MKYIVLTLILFSMINPGNESHAQNKLSKQEEDEGWWLLFDGQSLQKWRNYNSQETGSAWKIEDGALVLDTSNGAKGGDLVTQKEYEDFELKLEWKISACGNSGLMFNVIEDAKYHSPWLTGPEMQILDNTCHPDAKIHKHRAGDLYDLVPCSKETVKPAGEWNQVHIISKGGKYEFWLNGTKVVAFEMHTAEWKALVAKSKFNEFPDFGTSRRGRIALQDHGDKVWFRNIKIKPL